MENTLTDQQINEAVARKLGWTFCDQPRNKHYEAHFVDPSGNFNMSLPDYCHSIEAAWEIFDQLIAKGGGGAVLYSEQRKAWEAALTDGKQIADSIADADTAPMAICKAFLKLP